MSLPASRFRSASLLVLAFALGAAGAAHAQACCAGSSVLTPGRLLIHEDAVVGVSVHASDVFGSFDSHSRFITPLGGTSEVGFEEDALGTLRVLGRGQVSVLVPFVETVRQVPGITEGGGGVGDINLSARYDFVNAGESLHLPGLAVLVGVTVPSGRPPELARLPLATDSTGVGAVQLSLGLAAEQTYGHILVNATFYASQRLQRSIDGVRETLGVQLNGLAAVGYSFTADSALALALTYTGETDALIDGHRAFNTARSQTRLSVSGSAALTDDWRIQASLFTDLPVPVLGQNQTTNVGFTFTFLRSWS